MVLEVMRDLIEFLFYGCRLSILCTGCKLAVWVIIGSFGQEEKVRSMIFVRVIIFRYFEDLHLYSNLNLIYIFIEIEQVNSSNFPKHNYSRQPQLPSPYPYPSPSTYPNF